jgi:hypothetical protein
MLGKLEASLNFRDSLHQPKSRDSSTSLRSAQNDKQSLEPSSGGNGGDYRKRGLIKTLIRNYRV